MRAICEVPTLDMTQPFANRAWAPSITLVACSMTNTTSGYLRVISVLFKNQEAHGLLHAPIQQFQHKGCMPLYKVSIKYTVRPKIFFKSPLLNYFHRFIIPFRKSVNLHFEKKVNLHEPDDFCKVWEECGPLVDHLNTLWQVLVKYWFTEMK